MQGLQEHSPATRAVAQEKRRDFSPALAACGSGHIPVPGVVGLQRDGNQLESTHSQHPPAYLQVLPLGVACLHFALEHLLQSHRVAHRLGGDQLTHALP